MVDSETPLTILIATSGRSTLRQTLQSLQGQLLDGDRVICVVDGLISDETRHAWAEAGLPGELTNLEQGPHCDFGHTPRNRMLERIRNGYVYHLDDDDITLPHTLAVIREEISRNPGAFFLFRVVYPDHITFSWREHRIERNWVGTGIFVHPAGIPLGTFGSASNGDFDFISASLSLNPQRAIVWVDRVIGVIEPHRWTVPYRKYFDEATRGRHVEVRESIPQDTGPAHNREMRSPSVSTPPPFERGADETVLLTAYLTAQPDHHHECHFPSDAPELLLLAKTAERLGVDCLVFYDALSERFVREHSSRNIQFVKVPPPRNISNNDYRLYVYRDWLRGHRYKSVWCCDLFDVRLNAHPESMLDESYDLWIGTHHDWTVSQTTEAGRWMVDRFLRFFPEVPEAARDKPILMAGTFGGYYGPVKTLLERLTREHETMNPGDRNYDMALFNLVAHRDLDDLKVWTNGAPLHSGFRDYDLHAEVCFVHK